MYVDTVLDLTVPVGEVDAPKYIGAVEPVDVGIASVSYPGVQSLHRHTRQGHHQPEVRRLGELQKVKQY